MPGDLGFPIPMHQFQAPRCVFHERRATLHPVAVVVIQDALDFLDLRMMNMAADDPFVALPAACLRQDLFIVANELHRLFDAAFDGRAQGQRLCRPMRRTAH